MTTREAPKPPTHEQLLADLFELNFHFADLIHKHNLSPAQFLAFSKDETVRETLDAYEACQERQQRILARQNQGGAVGYLHQCIMDAPSTIETRRAATALARLTTLMLSPPRRTRPAKPEANSQAAQQATPQDAPEDATQHAPVAPNIGSSDDRWRAPFTKPKTQAKTQTMTQTNTQTKNPLANTA
jgi:hypothetical protein